MAVQYDKQLPARNVVAFKAEVQRWAAKIGVQPKRIQIQRMTTKWASCSPAGRICFDVELLAENATFQQVVIVHELLHLFVPNHGKLFRSLMSAYVPEWEQAGGARVVGLCGSRYSPIGG